MTLGRADIFGRRLLVSIDAKGYGGGDDQQHVADQDRILAVLDEAAAEARLDRAAWGRQGTGDGELAVLPPTEPEPRVVDDFARMLSAALRGRNRDLRPERRLRLRMAIHYGNAMPSSNGFSGQGIVTVSRLVDCPPLREALAASGADLAVAVSRQVFMDTVAQGHTTLEASSFREVAVRNKEFVDRAWLWLPGGDVHAIDLPDDAAPQDVAPPAEAPARKPASGRVPATVHNEFHGYVHTPGSTFGVVVKGDD